MLKLHRVACEKKKIVDIKWNEDNTTQEAVDENEDETAGVL